MSEYAFPFCLTRLINPSSSPSYQPFEPQPNKPGGPWCQLSDYWIQILRRFKAYDEGMGGPGTAAYSLCAWMAGEGPWGSLVDKKQLRNKAQVTFLRTKHIGKVDSVTPALRITGRSLTTLQGYQPGEKYLFEPLFD